MAEQYFIVAWSGRQQLIGSVFSTVNAFFLVLLIRFSSSFLGLCQTDGFLVSVILRREKISDRVVTGGAPPREHCLYYMLSPPTSWETTGNDG